jgi:hypothetical protein
LGRIELGLRFFLHFLICWIFTFLFAMGFKLPAGGFVSFAAAVGLTILGRSSILSQRTRDRSSPRAPSDNSESPGDQSAGRSAVWIAGLLGLCGGLCGYQVVVNGPNVENLPYLSGLCFGYSVFLWVLVYVIFLRRGRDWKVQAATFFCIYSLLFGLFILAATHGREQKAKMVSSVAGHIQSLLNDDGSRSLEESLTNIEPRASGRYGEIERWLLESLERSAKTGRELDAELTAIGWDSLLAPRRLQDDTGLVETRRKLERAKIIYAEFETRAFQCLQESAVRINSLNLSQSAKEDLRADLERGAGESWREMWQRHTHLIQLHENIVSLLESTKWRIDGDLIMFANDADARAYNAYLEQIQTMVAQLQKKQAESLREWTSRNR